MTTDARENSLTAHDNTAAGPKRTRHRDIGDLALLLLGIAVFIVLFFPIAYIVVYSFNTGRLLQVWEGFGYDAYAGMAANDTMKRAVSVSLRAGVGTSVVATVLGSLAGVALARRPGPWSRPFVVLLVLVLVTPEIVMGISLLPWFVKWGSDLGVAPLNSGILRLVIAHSLFTTAVVAFIVRARMAGIDELLEEAAADLYATPWRRFRQITLPLMLPGVLAGALMAFTLSLDNTIISAFVQVSGSTPWPVYILSSLRSSLRPEIAAMSTVMLLATLVSLGLVALVLKRSGDSSSEVMKTMGGQ